MCVRVWLRVCVRCARACVRACMRGLIWVWAAKRWLAVWVWLRKLMLEWIWEQLE